MLKWQSEKHASTFTVIQQNRRRPQEKKGNAFAYGENPYSQTFQYQGTLLGVHDVPEEYGFWITRAPFTTAGSILAKQERQGWILCHGGSMLFAFRYTGPARWDKPSTRESLELWRNDDRRGGWILETAPLADFAGGGVSAELQRFGDAILACKIDNQTKQSPPRLRFRNLKGNVLDLTWKDLKSPLKDECKLNGKAVDYSKFQLLRTNNASQPNGGALTLEFSGGRSVTYDFKNWAIVNKK
jgi:hypothetical protein